MHDAPLSKDVCPYGRDSREGKDPLEKLMRGEALPPMFPEGE